MKNLLTLAALFVSVAAGLAAKGPAIRSAPNFSFQGATHASTLRGLKDQPVVLLIARDARNGAFRKQLSELQKIYEQFASRKVVFAAALADGGEIPSNIPFVSANNPAQVAAEYGATGKFAIAIIGRDGNVDCETDHVLPAWRIRDIINNSFVTQAEQRK